MPKKLQVLKGEAKGVRIGFACTEDDEAILKQAAILDGRESIGEFVRARILPIAQGIVTSQRMFEFSGMMQQMQNLAIYMDAAQEEAKKTFPNLETKKK